MRATEGEGRGMGHISIGIQDTAQMLASSDEQDGEIMSREAVSRSALSGCDIHQFVFGGGGGYSNGGRIQLNDGRLPFDVGRM